MRDISESLIDHLVDTYAIGRGFARAYLGQWNSAAQFHIDAPADIDALPNPQRMWFRFAMSANSRGQMFLNRYRDLFEARTRSYLDIGCGMGGFLVAFAAEGFDVHGLEILEGSVRLARANLEDAGIPPEAVRTGDISSDMAVENPGRPYGVITANDVLEHVFNLEKTLQNISLLLADDGVFIAEVPNRDAFSAVLSDGHFSLFGITQLARTNAVQYFSEYRKTPYRVGDYYSIESYRHLFTEAGFAVQFEPLIEANQPGKDRVSFRARRDPPKGPRHRRGHRLVGARPPAAVRSPGIPRIGRAGHAKRP